MQRIAAIVFSVLLNAFQVHAAEITTADIAPKRLIAFLSPSQKWVVVEPDSGKEYPLEIHDKEKPPKVCTPDTYYALLKTGVISMPTASDAFVESVAVDCNTSRIYRSTMATAAERAKYGLSAVAFILSPGTNDPGPSEGKDPETEDFK